MAHVITYALKSGQDNLGIERAIKGYGYCKQIATATYIIETTNSSIQIRDNLKSYLGYKDELFISKLEEDWASINLGNDFIMWLQSFIDNYAA